MLNRARRTTLHALTSEPALNAEQQQARPFRGPCAYPRWIFLLNKFASFGVVSFFFFHFCSFAMIITAADVGTSCGAVLEPFRCGGWGRTFRLRNFCLGVDGTWDCSLLGSKRCVVQFVVRCGNEMFRLRRTKILTDILVLFEGTSQSPLHTKHYEGSKRKILLLLVLRI